MSKRKKRLPAWQIPLAEDPDDVMSEEEVAYLFQIGAQAVHWWAREGRIIPVPGSSPLRFMVSEVRRLYVDVGGLPEGHWRTWPRTPRRGLKQRR